VLKRQDNSHLCLISPADMAIYRKYYRSGNL